MVSRLWAFPPRSSSGKTTKPPNIWRVNPRGRGTCLLNNVLLGVSFEYYALLLYGRMAKLAGAQDLKSCVFKDVRVQVPLRLFGTFVCQ